VRSEEANSVSFAYISAALGAGHQPQHSLVFLARAKLLPSIDVNSFLWLWIGRLPFETR